MKQFSCGTVVSGCQAVFVAEQEEEILRQVLEHAQVDHGMDEVPQEVLDDIKQKIHSS